MTRPLITLLSDFGDADGYVGQMKGAILAVAPDARLVDLGHDLAPGDVLASAFTWAAAAGAFGPEAIHLAVVDPGVGGERRALAVAGPTGTFLAPDNGLLTGLVPPAGGAGWRAVAIENPDFRRERLAPTFHGRDLFAPAAAHLARGVALAALGPACAFEGLIRLPGYFPTQREGRIEGLVAVVDRFGNLRTNIPAAWLPARPRIQLFADANAAVAVATIDGLARTYADVAPGALLAYLGSAGTMEVAVRDAHAARRLGVAGGAAVWVSAG